MIRAAEIGRAYKFIYWPKCHVIALVADKAGIVVVFKHWQKMRWNYEAEPLWAFLQFAEERKQ